MISLSPFLSSFALALSVAGLTFVCQSSVVLVYKAPILTDIEFEFVTF